MFQLIKLKFSDMLRIAVILFVVAFFQGCTPKNQDKSLENPLEGEISIAADESFQPIVDAQITAYNAHYPKAKLNIKYMPEQKAVRLMMQDSVDVCIVGRALDSTEIKYYKNKGISYLPARMALEGVALITSIDSPLNTISIDDLKAIFASKSDKKLVFDNSNSSNLRYMIDKLGIKNLNQSNIFAADGNKDVIEQVKNNPNAIGVIGASWISDGDDLKARAIKKSVKVLSVSQQKDGKAYLPIYTDLKARHYPLERKAYLHTKKHYGLPKGFIRFCCAQIGQLVVEKMGLLPYYVIPKEMVVEKQSIIEMQKDKK